MMRSFIKKLAGAMALSMVVSLAAPAGMTPLAATDLKIAYQNGSAITEINLANIGDTEDLRFLGAPSNWKELGATWTSSNPTVATVDASGMVTAVGAGSAAISIKIGSETTAVAVHVVDLPKYTATMGTSDNRNITSMELKPEETFDFAFYGIKDYDKNRYICDWLSADDEVATVDNKGLVTAVAPGKTKITLSVANLETGVRHSVDSCVITVAEEAVATATPTPTEAPIETAIVDLRQTTARELVITFSENVDVAELTKSNIEIYEYHTNESEDKFEYAWQIYAIKKVNEEEHSITVQGYITNEFVDGGKYVVRYVEPSEDKLDSTVKEIATNEFVASVGAVEEVVATYASYFNNQGNWYFEGKAYTNASSGELVNTKIKYQLLDSEGVDVTEHYSVLADGTDLVTLELLTEAAEYVVEWDEDTNIVTFRDIPDPSLVQFKVVYEDYDNDTSKYDYVTLNVKEVEPYKITAIDRWEITINDKAMRTHKNAYRKWVALYDDYDLVNGTELKNHEIVLWFTDNYGNKYVTHEAFAGDGYEYISGSEKFYGEGYELRYETRHPQVLVVGDEDSEYSNSGIITTKKKGKANINVTLHNVYEDAEDVPVSRLGVLSVDVKEERYVKTVTAENLTVITDSKANNALRVAPDPNDNVISDDMDAMMLDLYDPRWTTEEGDIVIKDQYGDEWGIYNNFAKDSLVVTVEATNANVSGMTFNSPDEDIYTGDAKYTYRFDGVQLYNEVAKENFSAVTYKVTVDDMLNDAKKTTTFRVSLKHPTEKADGTLDTKPNLVLTANNVGFTDLKTDISVTELSKNGYTINYAESDDDTPITLITESSDYNNIFSRKSVAASKGALYLAVIGPKGEYVETLDKIDQYNIDNNTDKDRIGLVEQESGLYTFWVADTKTASATSSAFATEGTTFTNAGVYTVKLMEVTSVDADGHVKTFTTTTKKFNVVDDRKKIDVTNQKAIYLQDLEDDIVDVVYGAFSYTCDFSSSQILGIGIDDVRFRKNTKANAVVVQDVFVKVLLDTNFNGNFEDTDDAFYYVEVPVDMTVALDTIDSINADSVDYGKYPDGNKIQ